LEVEVVERKGLGHPDTICDAIAEQVCVRLCRHYLERFGQILHHNADKALLVGGTAHPSFGGGEVTVPMEIYLAGRATWEYRGERVPIHELAIDACDHWLRTHISGLDVDHDVRIISRLRAGSESLSGLFGRGGATPLANDTSFGTGFAPFTELERMVLAVERKLNHPDTKRHYPAIGEDVKVMGVRKGTEVELTIACAVISRHVRDVDEYVALKARVQELALHEARGVSRLQVSAVVNAADDPEHGDLYLTVTGTSAESGDDGEVGRGNRASGLITPYRPMTMEAVAGKNPVTHVGKLYNLLASRMAADVVTGCPGVIGAECVLVSGIGRSISDPRLVDLCVTLESGVELSGVQSHLRETVVGSLSHLPDIRDALLQQGVAIA
jgi:S-adenosylmethionine synthetase